MGLDMKGITSYIWESIKMFMHDNSPKVVSKYDFWWIIAEIRKVERFRFLGNRPLCSRKAPKPPRYECGAAGFTVFVGRSGGVGQFREGGGPIAA